MSSRADRGYFAGLEAAAPAPRTVIEDDLALTRRQFIAASAIRGCRMLAVARARSQTVARWW